MPTPQLAGKSCGILQAGTAARNSVTMTRAAPAKEDKMTEPVISALVALAGISIYGFIWFASRNMPRFAKILARLLPLGLVVPIMLALSMGAPTGGAVPRKATPPPKPAEHGRNHGPGSRAIAELRAEPDRTSLQAAR
jgi:hypothetical protein